MYSLVSRGCSRLVLATVFESSLSVMRYQTQHCTFTGRPVFLHDLPWPTAFTSFSLKCSELITRKTLTIQIVNWNYYTSFLAKSYTSRTFIQSDLHLKVPVVRCRATVCSPTLLCTCHTQERKMCTEHINKLKRLMVP